MEIHFETRREPGKPLRWTVCGELVEAHVTTTRPLEVVCAACIRTRAWRNAPVGAQEPEGRVAS